jgi:hypothetical protein
MRSALLIVLALAAESNAARVVDRLGVYPRADRRDARQPWGAAAPSGPLLSILPAGASIPGGECSGTAVTAVTGQSLVFGRSSAAMCQKSDGIWVSVGSGQMRASSRPGFPALQLERGATNFVHHSRDLTKNQWTKTNASCSHNATGIDGSSNSASTCSASSSSATVYQSIASPGAGTLSVFIKRVAGTGVPIGVRGSSSVFFNSSNCRNILTDAPADISSGAFVRCQFEGYDSSPQVGVIFANSGDSFIFDAWQDETYSSRETPTSPIFTQGSTATRSADLLSVLTPSGLVDATGCVAGRAWKTATISGNSDARVFSYGASARTYIPSNGVAFTDGGNFAIKYGSYTATSVDLISSWATGIISVAPNGLTPATAGYSGTLLGESVYIGGASDGSGGFIGFLGAIRMDSTPVGCAL